MDTTTQPKQNNDMLLVLKAAEFAARKHTGQVRKDVAKTPYFSHVVGVARIASELGGITDPVILAACLLHDTIEDTATTYQEIYNEFGSEVADVVMEVTDDKSKPKDVRKRAQVTNAPNKSYRAKIVKLCDKLYNLRDLLVNTPPSYSLSRIFGYIEFCRRVVASLRGINNSLEIALDNEIFNSTFWFDGVMYNCVAPNISDEHVYPTH